MENLIELAKFVKGLAPAGDRWNTDPATDIVNLEFHNRLLAVVHQDGGTTGKATLTVEACSDAAGTGATAVPFRYRVGSAGAGAGGDGMGAVTAAAAAGFDTTAATDRLYLLDIKGSELPAGKPWVRVKTVEAVNDPVNGSIDFLLYEPRYGGATQPTVIA